MRSSVAWLLAAVITVSGVQMASSADLPVETPLYKAALPVVYTWTGCYVGAAGGGAWGRSSHQSSVGPVTNNYALSGGIAGGTLGCNYQVNMWVLGLETDFSWTDAHGGGTDIPPFNPAATSKTREKWLGTVRGRVGASWGNELLYATGGFAYANAEIIVSGLGFEASESKTRRGWTVGAGWEHRFTPNISAKLEYLYVNLGHTAYFDPPPSALYATRTAVPLYDHIVRVGLNWKFWP